MTETTIKRHPIRGAIWGLILGLGVFLLLTVAWPVIGLDAASSVLTKAAIFAVVFAVLGALWGSYAPAKKPKGMAPAAEAYEPPPAPIEEAPPAFDDAPPPAPDVAEVDEALSEALDEVQVAMEGEASEAVEGHVHEAIEDLAAEVEDNDTA